MAPAAPPQVAPATSTPVRPAQPQQFHVSSGAAGTEWGGSPAPAGSAAAQGWSAYSWADDAGWQDPWTHSADPWTSWSSGWQQQDWRGWWGYTVPLSPPPGVPLAAAPEQWAGRAEADWTRGPAEKHRSDAQDDLLLESAIGDWSWPASSQDWSWPTKSYGWHPRVCSRDDSWGPRHTLDRKDIEKPEKYGGDITKWLQWSGLSRDTCAAKTSVGRRSSRRSKRRRGR